jgi:hypothetical protein
MSTSPLHRFQDPTDGVHVIHRYVFPTAGDRIAFTNEASGNPYNAVAPTAADVGSAARQVSDDTFWILTNHSPITWVQVSASPSGSGYDRIQEEGVNLTQRSTLDVVGEALTASDTGSKTQLQIAAYGLAGALSTIEAGDAAQAGAANAIARIDHQHAVATALAGDLAAADALAVAAGTGTLVPRNDHKHQVSTGAPAVTAKSEATAASTGTAATLVRTDAQIQVATAVPGTTAKSEATAAAQGAASTLLRSDAQIQVATATPAVTAKSEATAAAQGASSSMLRADAQIQVATAVPGTQVLSDASTALQGTSSSLLRADARLLATTAIPGTTVKSEATVAGQGAATTLLRSDAQIQAATAAPGTTVKSEATAAAQGAASTLLRSDAQIQAATAVPGTQVLSDASSAAQGTSASLLRADARLIATTAAGAAVSDTNSQGSSTSLSRADHGHRAEFPVLLWGDSSVSATTTTRYLTPGYADGTASTAPIQFRVLSAGTLRRLRVRHNSTAGNGNAIVYTVRVNGVASAVTVSLASTSSDGSDLSNTVAVAAGDLVDIEITKASSVGTSPSEVMASLEVFV